VRRPFKPRNEKWLEFIAALRLLLCFLTDWSLLAGQSRPGIQSGATTFHRVTLLGSSVLKMMMKTQVKLKREKKSPVNQQLWERSNLLVGWDALTILKKDVFEKIETSQGGTMIAKRWSRAEQTKVT